jgi:hypothetical protein
VNEIGGLQRFELGYVRPPSLSSSKPGRVRDVVVEKRDYWVASLARAVREAAVAGEVQPDTDADQVAWELSCLLVGANGSFVKDGGSVGSSEPVARSGTG